MSELEAPPPSTQPLTTPITPPPPPPAIGARLFTRTLSDSGEVCWVPARPDKDHDVRSMLVEIPDAVTVWTSSNLVAGEVVELVGDLQRITLESGNALEALAPAGWVYVGSVMGSQGILQMFGRGEPAIRAVAVVLADLMSAGNHPPAPGEEGPVPPIVEVELPWMDAEEPVPGAAPSRAVELIAQAFASIRHARATVDPDDGYTVLTGTRDLINPADKLSSDWLTDLLTHLYSDPGSVRVILKLVDCDNARWEPPYGAKDSEDATVWLDGRLYLGEVKLYIGAEFTAFGEALYQLATLPPADDDRGPVAPQADDAGMLVEADPVETCCELLAEVLDDAHYAVGSVQVSEHDDESVVVIGPVTFRISAPNFRGGSARVARVLGALGEALESRFLARHAKSASEE